MLHGVDKLQPLDARGYFLAVQAPGRGLELGGYGFLPGGFFRFSFTGQFLCVQIYFFISVHELEPQGHPHFFRVQLGFLI